MDTNDIERQLDVMKATIDDEFDKVDEHLTRYDADIQALAEKTNPAAIKNLTQDIDRLDKRLDSLEARLISDEIIDAPAENGLKEYTILHHVRVEKFDDALRLADALKDQINPNGRAEVVQTKVTAGVKELAFDGPKFNPREEYDTERISR